MEQQLKNVLEQFSRAVTAQVLCVLIILGGILITKNFFPKTFKELSGWYEKNLLADTSVSEVLEDENTNMSSNDANI